MGRRRYFFFSWPSLPDVWKVPTDSNFLEKNKTKQNKKKNLSQGQVSLHNWGALWAKRGERSIIARSAKWRCEAKNEGRRKIKRLLPVHCSGSSAHLRPQVKGGISYIPWCFVANFCLLSAVGRALEGFEGDFERREFQDAAHPR